MTPWWSEQMAGLYGGLGGAAIGIAGGVLGTMAGVLAPRGRARRAVFATYFALIATGVALLAAGLVAAVGGQPYHVWYPLVLGGGVLTLVLTSTLPAVRARYRQADARRLEAEELRRS